MSNWIPQLISIAANYRTGQTPTAQEINEFLNLLITQGNHNTEKLATLSNADLPAIQEAVNVISAAVVGGENQSLIDLVNKVNDLTAAYNTAVDGTVKNVDGTVSHSLKVGQFPIPNDDVVFEVAGGTSAEAPKTYMSVDPVDGIKLLMNGQLKSLLDIFYPVGTVYTTSKPTNPGDMFGGTWELLKGVCIYGVDTAVGQFATVNKVGGSLELQRHTHTVTPYGTVTSTDTSHNHGATTSTNITINNYVNNPDPAVDITQIGSNDVVEAPFYKEYLGTFASDYGANVGIINRVRFNLDHVHTGNASSSTSVDTRYMSHTHTFNGSQTTTSTAGAGEQGNLPPYVTKYIWERTA